MKKPESCQNHKLLTPSAEIQLIKQPRSVVEYRLACMYRGCVIYWKNWHSEQWENIKSEAKPFQLQRAYVKFMLWLLDFLQIESRAPNRMEMRFTRLRRSSLVRLIEEVAIRARPTIFFLSRNANWHRRWDENRMSAFGWTRHSRELIISRPDAQHNLYFWHLHERESTF